MVTQFASSRFSFFFFQAEDGIRDYKVTGVQTCALPIFPVIPVCHTGMRPVALPLPLNLLMGIEAHRVSELRKLYVRVAGALGSRVPEGRSEERRVGKGCRWRWAPARCNEKKGNSVAERQ